MQCSWHIEQCTLAEYCAFVARDVLGHMELAAEARVKEGQQAQGKEADADIEDDDEAAEEGGLEKAPGIVIDDIGNPCVDDIEDDEDDDRRLNAVSLHPLPSASAALRCAFNTAAYEPALLKTRLNDNDRMLLEMHAAYSQLWGETSGLPPVQMLRARVAGACGLQLGADAVFA